MDHQPLVLAGIDLRISSTVQVKADFTVQLGERLALIGGSGSGKTSLLRVIAGLEYADQGTIQLGDIRLDELPAEKRQVGFVFQDDALFSLMTVLENVTAGLRFGKRASPEEAEASGLEWLARVGLKARAHDSIDRLSGGERKRVALCRAWVMRPRVLLLDEPFNGLDADLKFRLMDELIPLHEQWSVPLIFVTHDPEEVRRISTRTLPVTLSDDGKVRHFR